MEPSNTHFNETSAAYAERAGVQHLLEEIATRLLQDRPSDPRKYLETMMAKNKQTKAYPSGEKTEAIATCICGGVEIQVKGVSPLASTLCHCYSCRRYHSAPLYHCLYFDTANVDYRNLKQTAATDAAITIKKGHELLVPCKGGPGNPNYHTFDKHPLLGGAGRVRCKECGVLMMNSLCMRPKTQLNPSDDEIPIFGVFPGTFTEKLEHFAQAWQPQNHINCESAILPITSLDDGLPKFREWAGGEQIDN